MLIRIAKIERFDSSSGGERCRQRLGPSRDELHFERAQFFKCLVHVAHDDRNMLKPKIVAAGMGRPRGVRCSVRSRYSFPSCIRTMRIRAPKTPSKCSYCSPKTSTSETF